MMSSGRGRLQAAGGAGVLAALLVVPLAVLAYRGDVARARTITEEAARDNIDAAFLASDDGVFEAPANTWNVNTADGWFDPYGETWTSPPIQALAEPALGGRAEREFDFDGRWLAVGVWTGGDMVVLTVVERDQEQAAIAAARWRWAGAALALVAATVALVWWLAGRIRGPVDRAHAVNRDFIADAAHELRTPLAIIQASAGHALGRERPAEDYRESLAEILEATERAAAGVGELLEFARLEAGQATPRLAPLRLDLVVEEVAAATRAEGVTVEAVPGEALVVSADYNLVRQMIVNLTSNATARASKVSLSTHHEPRQARIEIVDDGPGFDPGVIDHVFERFRRGDRSGSVGLGMAIARTIAELHGGHCRAANRPEGGAIVTVRIPYGNV